MDGSSVARNGGLAVRTTERGLPVALRIDKRELSKSPAQLAKDIVLLCQLSALRMQVARRRALMAQGVRPAVLRRLKLATEDDMARAEAALRRDPDARPDTWLTPI
ncbi:hypothetical protein MSAS_48180 [Mycobacterium saskatchewanense]|uniref:Uncharacterized protein n=1 Tax=Mycobacterium saskatchewanense TaxID=220927 RepID=A0AAJ3NV89_9MYCO|nr:hypothetical protein [Mycobacterium saskatchewanense]ORW74071.1 hypothetical protein AWC23_06055 [Mycobacterium saskatchewanense]BBX65644.1 hypothetical protein MSAS_48180 [Mycobacterium saskatchewanense]